MGQTIISSSEIFSSFQISRVAYMDASVLFLAGFPKTCTWDLFDGMKCVFLTYLSVYIAYITPLIIS